MQCRSRDFPSDQLVECRRFRILNIVDDRSRFRPGRFVELSISGARVARPRGELGNLLGLPEEIALANGPEDTRRAM